MIHVLRFWPGSGTCHIPNFYNNPIIGSSILDPPRQHKHPITKRPKFYSGFIGTSHEDLSSCAFRNSQGHTVAIKTISKRNIDYIKIHVLKEDQSQPAGLHRIIYTRITIVSHNLNAQFIHKRCGHALLSSYYCLSHINFILKH